MSSAAPHPDTPAIETVAPARIGDIAAEWRQLWRAVPAASPFLTPAWLGAWAETYAPGRTWAAALRDSGRLVALLPVFVWDDALLLAGTGPSDHGGALILPGYESWIEPLFEAAADAVDEPFGRIDLQQLSPNSPLAGLEVAGWRARTEAGDACVTLALGRAAASKARDDWHYIIRRLERQGGVIDLVARHEISEGIAELDRLHRLRWHTRDQPGMLADPLLRALLAAAAPLLAAEGLLRLHRLRLGSTTIAMLLALRGGDSICYFLSGFDPAYARFSPGTALVGSAIAGAAEEGAGTFDFLRGGEPYKYRWEAEDRPRLRRIFTRR